MFQWLYRIVDRVRDAARRRQWDADLALGRRGEDLAHRCLQRQGMTVVARNYTTPAATGEIDLIAWDADALVFVEVKTRSSVAYGTPDRAVDAEKRKRILRGAADYRRRTGVPVEKARFDIVSIVVSRDEQTRREQVDIDHRRNAFLPYEAVRAFAAGGGGRG